MEFRPQDIAQLVLGYLKDEKCQSALVEFINNSPHLRDHAERYHKGKHFVTRVGGLNLLDYLKEYANIYTIVQERLEASEYYNQNHSRTSLVEQLHYLLHNAGIESRASTPIPRTHHHTNFFTSSHQESTANSSSHVDKETQHGFNSISLERVDVGINATPAQDLPGNSSTEQNLNSSKNKTPPSSLKLHKSTSTEDYDINENSQEKLQLLSQTFLENTQMIDRIAENINKEVLSQSSPKLNKSSIQSIIERTEADPVFAEILYDLLEPLNPDIDNSSPEKNTDDDDHINEQQEGQSLSKPTTSKKCEDGISISNCLKERLRSTKRSHVSPSKSSAIDTQNNEAIDSIIAASLTSEREINNEVDAALLSSNSSSMSIETTQNTNYDTFTQTTISGTLTQNQPIYSNTSGLLMLQPSGTTTTSSVVQPTLITESKPCYIIGNQPFISVPNTPYKVLSEQDILQMPTIIVCDNQQPVNTQTVIVSSQSNVTNSSKTRLINIAPKITPSKPESLSEYITLYQCNESYTTQSQTRISPSKPRATLKQMSCTTTLKKPAEKKQAEKPQVAVQIKEVTLENSIDVVDNTIQTTSEIAINNSEVNVENQKQILENKHVTPKLKVEKKESGSRTTPRSGSHVRQLNFSTPEKWVPSMLRRTNTSPVMEKNGEVSKKGQKQNTTKQVRTTLFKSPDADVPESVTNQNKEIVISTDVAPLKHTDKHEQTLQKDTCKTSSSWDADLRALVTPPAPPVVQKQKRKRGEDISKQGTNNSKKMKENVPNLNKTEEDAIKIEMALQGIESGTECSENQTENSNDISKNLAPTPVNKRRDRLTTKKVISVKKPNKGNKDKQTKEKTSETVVNPPTDKLSSISVEINEEVPEKEEDIKKILGEQGCLEKPYKVINRNGKSRIKKKCNLETVVKKTPVPEEIVLTNVTKIKSLEVIDDGQNTLILSPSKLNANKRSLVEQDPWSTSSEPNLPIETDQTISGTNETGGKVTTPELLKPVVNNPPPVSNMMPLLETPVKCDPIGIPKTPGITYPIIDTPFTKAVIDQLTTVDLSAFPTPKFPVTPHFPFTPAHEQSPFSNRGTDYSTSSSYYQPSDTEQNKSIEQLIEECRRLETQSGGAKNTNVSSQEKEINLETHKPHEKTESTQDVPDPSTLPSKSLSKPQEEIKNTENIQPQTKPEASQVIKNSLMDKQKAFNHSMIGKKNLQLVKMLSENVEAEKDSSSENSSSDSDSSSSSSEESDSSECSFADVVPTATNDKNISPYSLRPRKSISNSVTVGNSSVNTNKEKSLKGPQKPCANKVDTKITEKPTNEPQKQIVDKIDIKINEKLSKDAEEPCNNKIDTTVIEEQSEMVETKPATFQSGVLKKMEQIRQRTIAKFKDADVKKSDSSKKKKPAPKTKVNEKELKVSVAEQVTNVQKINTVKPAAVVENVVPIQVATPIIEITDKPPSLKKKQRKSNSPRKLKQREAALKNEEIKMLFDRSSDNKSNLSVSKNKANESVLQPSISKNNQNEFKLGLSQKPKELEHDKKESTPKVTESGNKVTETVTKLHNKVAKQSGCRNDKERSGTSKTLPKRVQQRSKKLLSSKKPKQAQPLANRGSKLLSKQFKEAKATIDDEQFIFHLSSDGEDLEPFEIVETELLECSVSSTPIADEERSSYALDLSCKYDQKPISKTSSDEIVDPEAESLVKGLKQWGIHLVPNKSTKKSATTTESTRKAVFEHKDQASKQESSLHIVPKISNTEKQQKLNTTKEKCTEIVINKPGYSLKKGELLKGEEGSSKKKIKVGQHKPSSIKTLGSIKIDSRRNSDSVRENKKSKDKDNISSEARRCRSYSENKSIDLSVSTPKSFSLSSNKLNKDKTHTDFVENIQNDQSNNDTNTASKDKTETDSGKNCSLNEVDFPVEFDLRSYEQETLTMKHDYSKMSTRTLTDYDFDILTKAFWANVYIAEIDSEVEKILKFSPFELLLDIPSKLPDLVSKKKTTTSKHNTGSSSTSSCQQSNQSEIKKKNPLTILYNQLVKPGHSPIHHSPLEDLYAPESSREARKSIEESCKKAKDRNTGEKVEKCDKTHKSSKSKPKSVTKQKLQSHNKILARTKREGKSDDLQVTALTSSTEIKTIKDNSLSKNVSLYKKESPKKTNLEVIDGVVMLNSTIVDINSRENDELMNYALVGSERTENSDDTFTTENKKRKATDSSESGKIQEKKQKTEMCQELLRKIDVESFLKQLHGEM